MGNVMCCCRAREKLEDSHVEEEGVMITQGILKTASGDTNSIPGMKPVGKVAEKVPRVVSSIPTNTENRVSEQVVKSITNFSTFGGEHFNIQEDEFGSTAKTNAKKKRSVVGPLYENMAILNKPENKNKYETLSKSNLFIRIYVDYLEVIYKLCDDFGIIFKPYLEVYIEGQDVEKILPQTNFDGDLDKSLNISGISGISDNDLSFNVSQNMRGNTTLSGVTKERIYLLKSSQVFEVSDRLLQSNILFVIKNELPIKTNQKQNNLNLPPNVIIAEASVPIALLNKHFKNSSFDGCLKMKLRGSSLVGYLKTNITVSDQSLVNQEEFLDKLQKGKFLDVSQDDNLNKLNDNISVQSKMAPTSWPYSNLNFDDFSPEAIEDFFCDDNSDLDSESSLAAEILGLNVESLDSRDLYYIYGEVVKQDSCLALYQMLVLLVKLTEREDFRVISELFKLCSEKEKSFLFELPKFFKENAYLYKQYLIFIFNYSITIRSNKEIEDPLIINNVFECLKKNVERIKKSGVSLNPEYKDELKECIIWSLNICNEIISTSAELVGKFSKDELADYKKKENTVSININPKDIYENCIQIISSRIYILRIIDSYMNDSMVIGSMFRLFRKTVQVLTNESTSTIEVKKLNIHPREFSKNFKNILIEQNEGIYFTTLKIILMKYQHYPELHMNILIIIFQLTNCCDTQSLILAAEKLNLLVFRDVFELYRGKLRNFNKMMNSLHLNILSNFSEVLKESSDMSYDNLSKLISTDLNAYYKISPNYKKRLDIFRQNKTQEIEIHEIITRIGANITKSAASCKLLLESLFFDDIIEYLIVVAGRDADREVSQIENSETNTYDPQPIIKGPDFILKVKEKRKRTNLEEIKKIVSSILHNTITIIVNTTAFSDEVEDMFSSKLAEHDISSADDLEELLKEGRELMVKYGINVDLYNQHLEAYRNYFD